MSDVEPVLGAHPRHAALLQRLELSLDSYRSVFTDVDYWRPFVELVCARHAVHARSVESGLPGSFPTFIVNRTHVVKLFGPHFDGSQCWRAEIAVASVLEERASSVPVPEVIGAGSLRESPGWRYILSRFIEGEPFGLALARLSGTQRELVAHHLGLLVRRVHDVPVAEMEHWDDWKSFVSGQRQGLVERHREWGSLPDHLIHHVDSYADGYDADWNTGPVLVHADLHGDHVLGDMHDDEWRISGVIDWGDARVGDPSYELPALHVGLFHGDTGMLRAFLDAYGWEDHRSDAFVHRAMAMTLLHEFNVLEQVTIAADVRSMNQVAEMLWRV